MNEAAAPFRVAVAFGRLLRSTGMSVPTTSIMSFHEALGLVGLSERDPVYWCGRATLVSKPEDQPRYDRAFEVFWERRGTMILASEPPVEIGVTFDDDDAGNDEAPAEADNGEKSVQVRFSGAEVLQHKDFAAFTTEELEVAHRMMRRLRFAGAARRSRRYRSAPGRTSTLALPATVRSALSTGGEAVALRYRKRRTRPRRLVLLLDVSGSMEPYARAFVRFTHAAVIGRRQVEAFTLGTRLTRITRELSSHDPDRALRQTGDRVADWAGGTRLGAGLAQFNDQWGQRGTARGADVVILSDGWDRGDPAVMSEQMGRLDRLAHRIIWVNPLKATEGYAPLARGMAAALPYIDHFVEGHSLDAIERLAQVLGTDT
ncbi:MAG: putative carbon monoxide dehydrogenase accessory protein [Acidimicrobiia bacterium]|nr:putative carbon monoxide dehydrogenase accessory protein [Acidimicrobiia bacterium]